MYRLRILQNKVRWRGVAVEIQGEDFLNNVDQKLLEMVMHFSRLPALAPEIEQAAQMMVSSLTRGGKIFFCGNGGSAADAQHLAAELVGRFMLERAPLSAWALTANTSSLTAIANDYSYDDVFARQLKGLGSPGDVLIGISTSGNSRNILRAIIAAKEMQVTVIGMTGETGGKMAEMCDLCIMVPSSLTPRIQEMHIAVGHLLCEIVEIELANVS